MFLLIRILYTTLHNMSRNLHNITQIFYAKGDESIHLLPDAFTNVFICWQLPSCVIWVQLLPPGEILSIGSRGLMACFIKAVSPDFLRHKVADVEITCRQLLTLAVN